MCHPAKRSQRRGLGIYRTCINNSCCVFAGGNTDVQTKEIKHQVHRYVLCIEVQLKLEFSSFFVSGNVFVNVILMIHVHHFSKDETVFLL